MKIIGKVTKARTYEAFIIDGYGNLGGSNGVITPTPQQGPKVGLSLDLTDMGVLVTTSTKLTTLLPITSFKTIQFVEVKEEEFRPSPPLEEHKNKAKIISKPEAKKD